MFVYTLISEVLFCFTEIRLRETFLFITTYQNEWFQIFAG